MKKVILPCFLLCLLTISCKKSDDAVAVPDSYMSISAGSVWTYDVITDPGTVGATSVIDTVTDSGIDTTIAAGTADQRNYRIFSHTNGKTSSYYNITANDYYQFQGFSVGNVKVQELYLKDNAAVGTSWSQTVTVTDPTLPLPVPVLITNTVTDKGASRTVNGIVYTDVIGIKTDLSSTLLPGGIVTDIRSYYARKSGLIEGDYKIDIAAASVNVNTQTLLKTANIH